MERTRTEKLLMRARTKLADHFIAGSLKTNEGMCAVGAFAVAGQELGLWEGGVDYDVLWKGSEEVDLAAELLAKCSLAELDEVEGDPDGCIELAKHRAAVAAVDAVEAREVRVDAITVLNDRLGKERMLAAFDKAIELAGKRAERKQAKRIPQKEGERTTETAKQPVK